MGHGEAQRAAAWLAAASDDPAACRRAWQRRRGGVALLPAGRMWDVLIVPGRLGRAALVVLLRCGPETGPVLEDAAGHIGFLVPVGTADRWVGSGLRCAGAGSWVVVPDPAGAGEPGGVRWAVAPDGRGALSDPVLLELALHEASAGLQRGGEERR